MLKLYIYGYTHKIRSSRHLAQEAHRNIDLIGLLRGLKPTYKTIANFRKNNAHAFKNTFKEFVLLCQNINLIEGKLVALDAALMSKPAHHLMAYNSQIVVDDKEKLIVATAVSSKGNDMQELHHMASQAKTALDVETLDVVADKGYYSAQEIKKCVDDGIHPIVPPIDNQRQQKQTGRYGKDDFVYNEEQDEYTCPNNKKLTKKTTPRTSNGKVEFIYKSSAKDCKACSLRVKCLSDKTPRRNIQRWEHEAFIQAYRQNMQTASSKAIIKRRGAIVEHPFGTIKRTLGWDHYLVRGKEKVSGENALIMFCYNFKRVLNILGITRFKKVLLAIKAGDIEAIAQEIARYLSGCVHYSIIYVKNIYRGIKQGFLQHGWITRFAMLNGGF